ncbi:hypothetical protein H8356DRAFT_1313716 [Neocallimastix lanati (nom. inval.)]|nr:hypothetical protein H8356DRAFT_1313716 [Neocallimastix sp. JGI-2020a]
MNSINRFVLYVYFVFITICYTKLTDYLEDTNRTFNAIEGKVVTVKIDMEPKKYEEMYVAVQNSLEDYFVKYNGKLDNFETFEAKTNMTVIVDKKEKYFFEKVNFKVGGQFGRINAKLGYNIKLKKKDNLFGRRTLRLKADPFDYTHIRSKLTTDLMNKWEIPSIQESFARLYVNDEFFGLYFLEDAIKPSWILENYDYDSEEEVTTLYYCQTSGASLSPKGIEKCHNEKDNYLNYTQPLDDLVKKAQNYTTIRQLQKVFDVENLRKLMISEYLFGAYDNFLIAGHNYHFYQQKNGIWQVLVHDYDINFASDIDLSLSNLHVNYDLKKDINDYLTVSFDEWYSRDVRKPFVESIYYNDRKTFKKVLREMLVTGFNPDDLFARIDELYDFIEPYIVEDRTLNDRNIYPGSINLVGLQYNYTVEDSRKNKDYTMINVSFGLKQFIKARFDSVCKHYGFNKKAVLRDAAIYRKQVAINRKAKKIQEQIKVKKQELKKACGNAKKKIQKSINELLNKLNKLFKA